MISYYLRTGNVYVKINSETKEIINVVNTPIQKTISKLSDETYYNNVILQLENWVVSDETTFTTNYNEVKPYI
jgi:hypothetical protein